MDAITATPNRSDAGAISSAAGRMAGAGMPQSLASSAPDSGGAAYAGHRAALWHFGDSMIASSHSRGEPFTAILFDQVDLPELHALFGGRAARALVSRFHRKLHALAGSDGLAVRCGATTWTVLLPGHDQDRTRAAVRRVFGPSLAQELEGHEEILLVPRVSVYVVGRELTPMRHIHQDMSERIARAHRNERLREAWLRREAESYSSRPPLAAQEALPA